MQMIPINQLKPREKNPRTIRKGDPAIKELAASIESLGVLQPLVVRPNGEGFEILGGHRRHFAAGLVGLGELPCLVVEATEDGADEIALAENTQREDLSPLEEAELYHRLVDEHSLSVEQAAAQVGKSEAHVYNRLNLNALPKAVKSALRKGELTVTAATWVAKLRPDDQLEAFKQMPSRDAQWETDEVIRTAKGFLLELKGAPFPIDCEIGGVVACSECPKRTGQQKALFAGLDPKDDRCTDPTCFAGKRDANAALMLKEYTDNGATKLSDKEVAALFPYSGDYMETKKYVELDYHCGFDPKGRKARVIIGAKQLKTTPRYVAVSPLGRVVELVRVAEVKKALKAKPPKGAPAAELDDMGRPKQSPKVRRAFKAMCDAVGSELAIKKRLGKEGEAVLSESLLSNLNHAQRQRVLALLDKDKDSTLDAEDAQHGLHRTAVLVGVAVLMESTANVRREVPQALRDLCESANVDLAAYEKAMED